LIGKIEEENVLNEMDIDLRREFEFVDPEGDDFDNHEKAQAAVIKFSA
jgi:hypothetical protein